MDKTVSDSKQNAFIPPFPKPRPRQAHNYIWLRSLTVLPALLKNPIASFSEDAFEDLVSHTRLFGQPLVLVHDPELLRHIFVEKSDQLSADPIRQAVLKPALREGMLTAEGETWRKARRTIAPVFAPRHVKAFARSMRHVTQEYLKQIPSSSEAINIADHMTRLTYLVLSETLFSGDINEDGEKVLGDIAYFLKYLSQPDPLDLLGAPQWIPRLTKLRGTNALKRLRSAVRDTAQKRKAQIDSGNTVPDDFLTLLLRAGETSDQKLSLDEIEDNLITFIAAGHETTSRALAWTLYLLSFDQMALEKCEAEIDALDMDNTEPETWQTKLPWLTACLEESMRLFPPGAVISRKVGDDIDHNDLQIPKGANVIVSPWILHRHKAIWERPNEFDPSRFFGDNRKKIGRFEYLPFGIGPRICIGASFAMQEALIIVALLMRQFRFTYSGSSKPNPVMRITLQPDNGVPMTVMQR